MSLAAVGSGQHFNIVGGAPPPPVALALQFYYQSYKYIWPFIVVMQLFIQG